MLKQAYGLARHPDSHISVFDNGLTGIALRQDAAALVSVRVYIRAGSVFENRHLGCGISHLLEHLVTCDGAGDHSEADMLRIADEMGGLMNAYTSVDHLCYYSTASVEQMDRAMGVLSDYAIRPHLSNAVFERELGVVQRELERDRDDPDVQLEEIAGELAYRGHPLALPIIGYRERLLSLTHASLVDWYRETHGGENTVVVISGAVDPSEAMRCIAQHMAKLSRGALLDMRLPEPTAFLRPRTAIKQMQVESVSNTLQWRTIREGAPDDVALDVLSTILTDGDDARLVRALKWDAELVYDIGGTHDSHWHTPGVLNISAQFDAGKTSAVLKGIHGEIENLSTVPVTKAELGRAVQKIKLSVLAHRQTAEGLAAQVAEDYLALHDAEYSDRYLAELTMVSVDDVQRAAMKYIYNRPWAEARIEPVSKGDQRLRHKRVAQSAAAQSGISKLDGPNGATLIARSISKQPFVALHAVFEGGLLYETAANGGWFHLFAQLWTRGTKQHSADEIAAAFAEKGTALRATAGMNQIGLGFCCLAEDFEALLLLWHDVLTTPALYEDELNKVRPSILDAIARQDEQWGPELMRFVRACCFSSGPWQRSRRGTVESISRAGAADVRELHRAFIGANLCNVALAGDVDSNNAVAQVEALLEQWRANATRPDRPAPMATAMDSDRLFVKQSSADREVAGVFIGFSGIDLHDVKRRAPVALIETMLAGYALSGGRLFERLRGSDDDLAYEVGSVGFSGLIPGLIGFMAGCEPDRVNDVYHAMRADIDALRDGQFDEAELQRAKTMIRMGELDQHQTPADLAARLAVDHALGLGVDDLTRFLVEVNEASLEDVRAIAKSMLTTATVCIATPDPDVVDLDIVRRSPPLIP